MVIFELKNKLLSIKVNSFGAELCSVISADTAIEYIWQADTNIWARHAPNLFPIVGKLKNGTYQYLEHTYQLPQHGFARDNEFICIEQSDTILVFEYTASEITLKKFPFHFSLQIKYTIIDNKLEVNYLVFNPDSSNLYFSIGAHPAFNCPLTLDESFTDYELVFLNKKSVTINALSDGLITSETKDIVLNNSRLAVTKELFKSDALVFMNHQIDEVQLVSTKTKHGVSLISKNWPYFGIWSKPTTEQFVCLEPWFGIADSISSIGDITKKEGIIKLESEHYFNCSFDMLFF